MLVSVVIAPVSGDSKHLEACLASLPESFDIIVPLAPDSCGDLPGRYPHARFAGMPGLNLSERITRGLALAHGDVIALIKDNCIVAPDWGERLIEAHHAPSEAIGGAIENGIDKPLNWALYFCDFLTYQNPIARGESERVSDANASFKRAALEGIRPVWEREFHEQSVSAALLAKVGKMALAPDLVVYQHRVGLRLHDVLRERFVWGRSFGAWRGRTIGRILFAPAIPALVMARLTRMAIGKRRTLRVFLKVLPLTALLILVWSCGELTGYVTNRPSRRNRFLGSAKAR